MENLMRVKFYKEEDRILAVFPDEKHNRNDGPSNTCYTHCEQHALCHPDYYSRLPLATPEEYKALAAELAAIGYNLRILNKVRRPKKKYQQLNRGRSRNK